MEIPAEDMYVSEEMPRYDAACKKILSNKIFLAWLMKYCVEEYADAEIDDIVEHYIENVEVSTVGVEETGRRALSGGEHILGMKNEETSLHEGTSTFDIRFFALAPKSGDFIRIIINIEAQNRFDPGYPLVRRALYYCSRMIAAQNGVEFRGKNFQDIKKVYSIWVCMEPPKKWQNNITRYAMTEEKLLGEAREKRENYDLMTAVMVCLGDEKVTEELNSGYKPLLKMLEVLFSQNKAAREKKQIMQEDFGIRFTEPMEKEAEHMCNLSQGVYEKGFSAGIQDGMQRGMQRGLQQGMQRGLQQGMQRGEMKMLYDLVKMGWLSIPQASEKAKLPEEVFLKNMKEYND